LIRTHIRRCLIQSILLRGRQRVLLLLLRQRQKVRPAPLLQQQQSILQTLVDKWEGMDADERKRMLVAIFETVMADGEGVMRLEPCEDWRPCAVVQSRRLQEAVKAVRALP
jgi:hypothetical protein